MHRTPLKLRELLKRLARFGVVVMNAGGSGAGKRGKGSELILLRPESEGSKRGPIYPIKNHGYGKDVPVAVIKATLRRFDIDEEVFWE